jgi:hypothetical protein
MPVILVNHRRTAVQADPGIKVRPYSKITKVKELEVWLK